jgi:hypothetical protein
VSGTPRRRLHTLRFDAGFAPAVGLMAPARGGSLDASMPGDPKKMVVGFNHNIKHKGKPYHIQTEDSGLENPHIITHLFVGGNILASKKTSYADIVAAENLTQVVRELMEEQHKEMLRNLVNGVYDDVDATYSAQAQAYQPGQLGADRAPSVKLQAGVALPRPPAARALPTAAARVAPALRGDGAETLFGEELMSEKSLDEVILSYLADDLGERK